MTHARPVLVLLVLVLAGCGDSDGGGGLPPDAAALVGRWTIDWDASEPLIERGMQEKLGSLPPEQRRVDEPKMREAIARMREVQRITLQLQADGAFSFEFGAPPQAVQTRKGRWTKTGESVDLAPTEANGKAVPPGSKGAAPMHVVLERGLLRFAPRPDAPDQGFLLRKE